MSKKEVTPAKGKKIIEKYFGNSIIQSFVLNNDQIDINFKSKEFILGYKDFKFLNSFGFRFSCLYHFEKSGITIVLLKDNNEPINNT